MSAARYPWDAWFDGDVHVLRHGVDFDVAPAQLQDYARAVAYARGVPIATRRLGGVLLIQAVLDA